MQYGVYEVYTWDDVTYTLISTHDTEEDAKRERVRLSEERRMKNYDPDPISYTVMSDIQYSLRMR